MRRQKGIALVQVLLVVALLIAVATELVYRQHLTISTTRHWTARDQGQQWLLAVESVAQADIRRYLEGQLTEPDWRAWSDRFELEEGGEAVYRLLPQQHRFNLNWLHPESRIPVEVDAAETLLSEMGADPAWVRRLVPWLHGDDALDTQLRARAPGYQSSGMPLAHRSELTLLQDEVIPLSSLQISSWGTFLPPSTPLNLRSTSRPTLAAVWPSLTDNQWGVLEELRQQTDFAIEDWLEHEVFADTDPPESTYFTLESRFFRSQAVISFRDRQFWLTSWIYADRNGTLNVYQRHFMPLPSPLDDDPAGSDDPESLTGSNV